MQKTKSRKRINKTVSVHEVAQQAPCKLVADMVKQIQQLKIQLASIKSKKNLNICPKQLLEARKMNKKQSIANLEQTLELKQKTHEERQERQDKQNKQKINKCKCNKSKIKQQIKINLVSIDASRSRQTKLKFRIQLNKLQASLERLYKQIQQTQIMKLTICELNTILTFTNSIVKQYQYELQNKNTTLQQMRTQLTEVTNKVIKLAEKHSNQKCVTSNQMQEINELKRHLSYYMELLQDSNNEEKKYKQENASLETYANQLQHNNNLIKKQLKLLQQQKELLFSKNQQIKSQFDKINKQFEITKNDLHIITIECEKNKEKWKRSQKQYEKQIQQFKGFAQNYKLKQLSLQRKQHQIRQLGKSLQNLRSQQNSIALQLGRKNIDADKYQRQILLLKLQVQQKKNKITELDRQIDKCNKQIEKRQKQIHKLNDNLNFCQMEIQSMTQQLNNLKQANERYKNQHFRVKALENQQLSSPQKNNNRWSQKKQKSDDGKYKFKNYSNSKNRNKQLILGEIQQLIQKHKRKTQSDESEDNQQ